MKKYELTEECREFSWRKLYRIKALTSFSDVKEGDLGGWIEKKIICHKMVPHGYTVTQKLKRKHIYWKSVLSVREMV